MSFIDVGSTGPGVRFPRAWLQLSGGTVPCITATVIRRSEADADVFSAELSINETEEFAGYGYAEWADYQPSDVQILMALDGSEPISVVTGQIDTPHIHWGECTVTVSGRDKSASLTEKRRSAQFKNQTSAEIVQKVAQDHGLSAVVSAGSDFAGKIYNQDYVHLLLNLSDHEVLTRLAQRESARWYVEGKSLFFEPIGTTSDTYNVEWVPPDGQGKTGFATCLDLETFRDMTAARPHQLAVRSWHHKDAKKYDGLASADGLGPTVEIEHHHNGRNQAQVDKISKSRLKDAIRHDCNIIVKAPLDLTVTPRQKLNLTGTGTIFDQLYDIDSVEFVASWGGSEMSVTGKIAKSGRGGSDDTGSTKFSSPTSQGGIGHA